MIQDNIVVFCTVPSENIAKKIAGELIKNHIAACCNIVKGLTSIYFWENQVQEDNELLLIIKTKNKMFDKLEKTILEIHPYEIPEIIALPIIRGHNKYIKWIDENVK
jgi:periplasmic divalent cation tolerance protein